jgi:hypothetical protein
VYNSYEKLQKTGVLMGINTWPSNPEKVLATNNRLIKVHGNLAVWPHILAQNPTVAHAYGLRDLHWTQQFRVMALLFFSRPKQIVSSRIFSLVQRLIGFSYCRLLTRLVLWCFLKEKSASGCIFGQEGKQEG